MTDEVQPTAEEEPLEVTHARSVATNVETIRQLVQDIRDRMDAQAGGTVDLTPLLARFDSLNSTLSVIQAQANSNGSGISQLQSSVNSLMGMVTSLQAAVSQIQTDLEGAVAPSNNPPPPAPSNRPPAASS